VTTALDWNNRTYGDRRTGGTLETSVRCVVGDVGRQSMETVPGRLPGIPPCLHGRQVDDVTRRAASIRQRQWAPARQPRRRIPSVEM